MAKTTTNPNMRNDAADFAEHPAILPSDSPAPVAMPRRFRTEDVRPFLQDVLGARSRLSDAMLIGWVNFTFKTNHRCIEDVRDYLNRHVQAVERLEGMKR